MHSTFFRPFALVCALICLALSGAAVPVKSANPELVAHEWGTFTSVAGSDGKNSRVVSARSSE